MVIIRLSVIESMRLISDWISPDNWQRYDGETIGDCGEVASVGEITFDNRASNFPVASSEREIAHSKSCSFSGTSS